MSPPSSTLYGHVLVLSRKLLDKIQVPRTCLVEAAEVVLLCRVTRQSVWDHADATQRITPHHWDHWQLLRSVWSSHAHVVMQWATSQTNSGSGMIKYVLMIIDVVGLQEINENYHLWWMNESIYKLPGLKIHVCLSVSFNQSVYVSQQIHLWSKLTDWIIHWKIKIFFHFTGYSFKHQSYTHITITIVKLFFFFHKW